MNSKTIGSYMVKLMSKSTVDEINKLAKKFEEEKMNEPIEKMDYADYEGIDSFRDECRTKAREIAGNTEIKRFIVKLLNGSKFGFIAEDATDARNKVQKHFNNDAKGASMYEVDKRGKRIPYGDFAMISIDAPVMKGES